MRAPGSPAELERRRQRAIALLKEGLPRWRSPAIWESNGARFDAGEPPTTEPDRRLWRPSLHPDAPRSWKLDPAPNWNAPCCGELAPAVSPPTCGPVPASGK